jgi:aspartyl-tRNA(Asn)/glutamyl-tRNA(Gln) amidotransferase subunit C
MSYNAKIMSIDKSKIEKEEIRYLAQLSRIELEDKEIGRYQKEISSILSYFDQLKEVDTDGVDPYLR